MNKEAILRTFPLFSHVNDKALKSIASLCTERSFEKDQVLMKQGDDGIGLYIIVSGSVLIKKHDPEGHFVEEATNRAGDFIGEFSVFDGAPRSATVVALEPTVCLVLASWEFMGFLKAHPELALDMIPMLVKRFRETNAALIARKSDLLS